MKRTVKLTLRLLELADGKGLAAFVLADDDSKQVAKDCLWRLGGTIELDVPEAREHGSLKYAHKLGRMLREQVQGYEHLDAHEALKKLQAESGIHCELTTSYIPGMGKMVFSKPKSLGYDTVKDEKAFRTILTSLCEYIAIAIWPTMTAEQVMQQVELVP